MENTPLWGSMSNSPWDQATSQHPIIYYSPPNIRDFIMFYYILNLSLFFSFLTVCLSFLGKFYQSLQDDNVQFTSDAIEKALVKVCKDAKGKENRFVSKAFAHDSDIKFTRPNV